MDNYYQRNMDQFECHRHRGVQYNQLIEAVFNEGSMVPDEPVTLDEVILFSGIDIDEDDALIEETLIPAGRQILEENYNIGFVSRSITATFNNGNGGFYLPYGPVTEIDTVTADDVDANAVVKNGQVLTPHSERLTATYTAGYEVLPAKLRTALLNQIRYLYDNRSEGKTDVAPMAAMIMNPLSRVW